MAENWRASRIASLERAVRHLKARGGPYSAELIAGHEAKIARLREAEKGSDS